MGAGLRRRWRRSGPLLVLPAGKLVRSDDREGFWLALPDQGLLRIGRDGEVRRLSESEDHSGSAIQCLFTDHEDNLWIGYDRGGLARVRQRRFESIGKPEGLADPVITSVCEDSEGALWIGTVSGTLSRWKNGECTNLSLPGMVNRGQFVVVCPEPDGRLWIGTSGKGLLVREGGHPAGPLTGGTQSRRAPDAPDAGREALDCRLEAALAPVRRPWRTESHQEVWKLSGDPGVIGRGAGRFSVDGHE